MSFLLACVPYVLVTVVLVVTRVPFFRLIGHCKALQITFEGLLGRDGVDWQFQWAWLPGTVFILVSVLAILLHGLRPCQVAASWKATFRQMASAAIAMIFGTALVQLMLHSNVNTLDIAGMMTMMANSLAQIFGPLFLLVSPFVGVLGAFISGSCTVSCMLFTSMQYETASLLQLSAPFIVSLQCVGGGIGNMICVNNIVAACSTVGVKDAEGKLVRRNLIPMVLYCAIVLIAARLMMLL